MYCWEMVIHYIYKIHFLCGYPSGRYYIGKHSHRGNDLSKDRYSGSGGFCISYFKKYGKIEGETYIKEILEFNNSFELNNTREIFWIGDLYKTDKLCMNRSPGGTNLSSTQTREKVCQIDLYGNIIKVYNSQLEAASELGYPDSTGISKCCLNKNGTYMGYIWKFEKDVGSFEASSISVRSKPIIQYSKTGVKIRVYSSIKSAVEINGWNDDSGISACCMRRRNSAYGFLWRFYNDQLDLDDLKDIKFSGKRCVLKIKDGVIIEKYDSIADAAIKNNMKHQSIQRVCAGKRKSSGGFVWMYYDEN